MNLNEKHNRSEFIFKRLNKNEKKIFHLGKNNDLFFFVFEIVQFIVVFVIL